MFHRRTGETVELWDIYDEDRNLTGRKIKRGKSFQRENIIWSYMPVFLIPKGEMLIQKRQSTKRDWPNLWDISAGGCAVAGEDSRSAMEREIYEELGIRIDLTGVRPRFVVNFAGGFDDIYIVEKDICPEELKLQKEEVQTVCWVTKEEYLRMIEAGEAMPFYSGFIAWVFESFRGEGFFKE